MVRAIDLWRVVDLHSALRKTARGVLGTDRKYVRAITSVGLSEMHVANIRSPRSFDEKADPRKSSPELPRVYPAKRRFRDSLLVRTHHPLCVTHRCNAPSRIRLLCHRPSVFGSSDAISKSQSAGGVTSKWPSQEKEIFVPPDVPPLQTPLTAHPYQHGRFRGKGRCAGASPIRNFAI